MSNLAENGASILVNTCAQVQPGEKSMIIVTSQNLHIGQLVLGELAKVTENIVFECMEERKIHGEEPNDSVADNMVKSDVIFCLTPMSLAHTQARKAATLAGARYLSLPDYSLSVLESKALHTDFNEIVPVCNGLAGLLDAGQIVEVKNAAGTNITFSIDGRSANRCPGIVNKPGQLGSPPDAEVNIAPLEGLGNGLIVVDGSVPCPGVGVVKEHVHLTVRKSTVVTVKCLHKETESTLSKMFDDAGPKSRIIGEFGIGLNPNAVLCGVMLEDEGCAGTIHFGIGSNATIGGVNDVSFHLDFIIRDPSVWIDGAQVLNEGSIVS